MNFHKQYESYLAWSHSVACKTPQGMTPYRIPLFVVVSLHLTHATNDCQPAEVAVSPIEHVWAQEGLEVG